jgi:hypothetical protein
LPIIPPANRKTPSLAELLPLTALGLFDAPGILGLAGNRNASISNAAGRGDWRRVVTPSAEREPPDDRFADGLYHLDLTRRKDPPAEPAGQNSEPLTRAGY